MTERENTLDLCGCMSNMVCPECDQGHKDWAYDINGDGWHIHACPFCGIDFLAYGTRAKEIPYGKETFDLLRSLPQTPDVASPEDDDL